MAASPRPQFIDGPRSRLFVVHHAAAIAQTCVPRSEALMAAPLVPSRCTTRDLEADDHTFSTAVWRNQVNEWILECLESW